jgi:nicotinate-nucleotide pyrophosphorylase (carboxylating)
MPREEEIVSQELEALARLALSEDAPRGDTTSSLTIPAGTRCTAELIAKQHGVLAGVESAAAVFSATADEDARDLSVDWKAADGATLDPGDRVALLHGDARTVLRAERPALNLLGHLSGIATLTRAYVDAAVPAQVLCTRKTLPGLRAVEREAVAAGGGALHRASLSDAILIKDTHVRIAGGVAEGVRRAQVSGLPVEVEVETIEQLGEALEAGADRILLDNFSPASVAEAVALVDDPTRLEISGGVTLDTIRSYVDAGARVLSVGRLTHSAPALDLSLEVVEIDG